MAIIGKLTKRDGTVILPNTRAEAVIMDDEGTTLTEAMEDVQGVINALSASTISNTPNGSISATNVQDAINELDSEKSPINSPTFTGTVSGITASMVGLGNVTNESKATMFTSPTFTGTPTLSGVGRIIADSASTGTDVYFIWSGTQAQYDAIGTKDANTLYFIV